MQTTAPTNDASPFPIAGVDTDEPVAVIPTASVAPLDGPPDGERVVVFTVAPKTRGSALEDSSVTALGAFRQSVLSNPVAFVAGAFSLGFVLSRMRR